MAASRGGHAPDAYHSVSGAPLLHAAGHDHSLQVLDGDGYGVDYLVVSGSAAKSTAVKEGPARFATREKGFMRLEFAGSDVRLTVMSFGRDGQADARGYCQWLRGAATSGDCSR